MSPSLSSLLSVIAVSGISLIGVLFFTIQEKTMQRILLPLVGFSTGALLGDVFLHILPEIDLTSGAPLFFALTLLGILLSFVLEKFIHWRHCHLSALPEDEHDHHHHHTVGTMSLIGDALHNLIDGALIAGSFLVNPTIGIATTLAVAFHEIPHEIGNVAILLYSGYERRRAVLMNLLSALVSVVGALVVLGSSTIAPLTGVFILPIAAGNLLYIAGSDLIPELHKDARLSQSFIQLLCILAGIGLMAGMKLIG